MPLHVNIRPAEGGVAVVTLTGPLTLGTNLKVTESQIASKLGDAKTHVVLDLGGVPYIDSAGLGMLMYLRGRTEEQGGNLRLARVSDRVVSMLRMTQVEGLFQVDPDVDASLNALSSR